MVLYSVVYLHDLSVETDALHSVLPPQNRKRKDAGSQYNGTTSPKRHRESVLRLTGEDGRDGGLAPARACLEEDGDLESLDRSIVQFTVGGDDGTDVLVPIINPNLEAEDVTGTRRRSLSSSQDSSAKTSGTPEPSEYTNAGWMMLDRPLNLMASLNLAMKKQWIRHLNTSV